MKNLSLNSVNAYLTRDEMRSVNGGRLLAVRNLQATGQVFFHGGSSVCQCSWQYNENDGTGWHSRTGACPTGSLEYSCI